MRIVFYLLEMIGVVGIVGLLAFIPLTKVALGAALACIGAFFPTIRPVQVTGDGEVRVSRFRARFRGGVRIGVILGGLILLVGAVLTGVEERNKAAHKVSERYQDKLLNDPKYKTLWDDPKFREVLKRLDDEQHRTLREPIDPAEKE